MRMTRRILMAVGILLLVLPAWLKHYVSHQTPSHHSDHKAYFQYWWKTSGPVPLVNGWPVQRQFGINPKRWSRGVSVQPGWRSIYLYLNMTSDQARSGFYWNSQPEIPYTGDTLCEIQWRWTFAPGLAFVTIALLIRMWEKRKRKGQQDGAFPVVQAERSKRAA
jgi:hypothetical protein